MAALDLGKATLMAIGGGSRRRSDARGVAADTRLAEFYADPADAVAPVHLDLAVWLRSASWHSLRGHSLDHTVHYLRDLAPRP